MPKVSTTPFTVSRTVAPLLSEHAGPAVYYRKPLSMAHQILDGIPESAIDLDDWVTELKGGVDAPACGTIACGGVWLAMHPYFHKRGLYLHDDRWAYCPKLNNEAIRVGAYGSSALAEVFVHEGEVDKYGATLNLFGVSEEGQWDRHLISYLGNPSDKELLLARIKYAYHYFSK